MPEETKPEIETFLSDVLEEFTANEDMPAGDDDIAARDQEKDRSIRQQEAMILTHAVKEAIRDAGGNYVLLEPHMSKNLALRNVAGVQTVVLLDASGEVRAKEDGTPITLADRMAEMKSQPDMAAAFVPLGGRGAGVSRSGYVSHQQPIRAHDQEGLNAHIEDIATGRVRVTL